MADDTKHDYPEWIETVTSVLGAIGFNRVRVRFKLRKWVTERRAARNRRGQAVDHVTYAHRVCDECGAINDRGETVCVRCGQPMQARALEVAGRLGLRPPTSATTLIALGLVVVYVRLVLATGLGPTGVGYLEQIVHGARLPDEMHGEWWRHATSVVMHDGLLSLGLSLLTLFVAGPMLEERYGRWMVLPVFMTSALVGSVFSAAVADPLIAVTGAAGGMMGIVGCMAGHGQRLAFAGLRRGRTIRNEALLWSLFVMFFGYWMGADFREELGGFVVGAVLGFVVKPEWVRGRALGVGLGVVGLLALLAAVAAAVLPVPSSHGTRIPTPYSIDQGLAIDDEWPTDAPGDPDDLGSKVWVCTTVAAGDRRTVEDLWRPEVIDEVCAELASLRKACAADTEGVLAECAELKRVDAWFGSRAVQP